MYLINYQGHLLLFKRGHLRRPLHESMDTPKFTSLGLQICIFVTKIVKSSSNHLNQPITMDHLSGIRQAAESVDPTEEKQEPSRRWNRRNQVRELNRRCLGAMQTNRGNRHMWK